MRKSNRHEANHCTADHQRSIPSRGKSVCTFPGAEFLSWESRTWRGGSLWHMLLLAIISCVAQTTPQETNNHAFDSKQMQHFLLSHGFLPHDWGVGSEPEPSQWMKQSDRKRPSSLFTNHLAFTSLHFETNPSIMILKKRKKKDAAIYVLINVSAKIMAIKQWWCILKRSIRNSLMNVILF